jgi:hypothetical protein
VDAAEPTFLFHTFCEDSGADFSIQTICEVWRGDALLLTAKAIDTSSDPIFMRMVERESADPLRGPRWVAERIIKVQREMARDSALASLAAA